MIKLAFIIFVVLIVCSYTIIIILTLRNKKTLAKQLNEHRKQVLQRALDLYVRIHGTIIKQNLSLEQAFQLCEQHNIERGLCAYGLKSIDFTSYYPVGRKYIALTPMQCYYQEQCDYQEMSVHDLIQGMEKRIETLKILLAK